MLLLTYINIIGTGKKKDKIIFVISKLFAAFICKKDRLCEYFFVIAPLPLN